MQAKHGSAVLFRPRPIGLSMVLAMAVAVVALVFASTALAVTGPPTVETRPADGINQTEAHLHANVNPNNVAVTECKFEYGTTNSYGKSVPCNQAVPFNGGGNMGVDAMVKGLTFGTTYHFRISATNGDGTSTGSDLTFTTHFPPHQTYLASGDSLAFGYSQQLFNENFPGEDPHHFEHGYANAYLALLEKETANGVERLTNDGCPGETTNSLIGEGQLAAALGGTEHVYGEEEETSTLSAGEEELNGGGDVGKPDEHNASGKSPCKYKYTDKFRLHNEYGGTHSQLENVLEEIQKDNKGNNPDHPVTRMTLNIGANDELHAVTQCEEEVGEEYGEKGTSKYNPENAPPEGGFPEKAGVAFHNCVIGHVAGLFGHILGNIGKSLTAIREGSKFCVNSPTPTCDAGHKGVNYTGEIVLLGGYDPYGRVFCKGETFAEASMAFPSCMGSHAYSEEELKTTKGELVPESRNLTALLNANEKAVASKFGACLANPEPKFNPDTNEEPARLQEWTNMDNKNVSNGKADGNGKTSDIHPTPAGYSKLGSILKTEARTIQGETEVACP